MTPDKLRAKQKSKIVIVVEVVFFGYKPNETDARCKKVRNKGELIILKRGNYCLIGELNNEIICV